MTKALVLGCGASGLAAARHLTRLGWSVRVADTRENPPAAQTLARELPQVEFCGGTLSAELLDGCDLLVMSPGLSPEHSQAACVCARARELGVEIIGEIELFARRLQALNASCGYCPRVVAITGTNGKTTTTTLVGLMCQQAGRKVCVAGNIGPNAVTELDKAEAAADLPQIWVLELSSFQLETTSSLRCDAAAFLNLTEDHVDWHGSMLGYEKAKVRIFSDRTTRVLNRDDAITMRYAVDGSLSFGQTEPQRDGEYGLIEREGHSVLARRVDGQVEELIDFAALKLRGRHNAMNSLAAIALVSAVDVELAPALEALAAYPGGEHRVSFVLSHKGIDFIDDSKGTNVGATTAALVGLGSLGQKCAIILGGDGKGQDFSPLARAIEKYARYVVLIGRDGEKIGREMGALPVPVEFAGTDFEKAIDMAYKAAHPGDAVLLSPACASWDMFSNYAERARRFVTRAEQIAREN